MFEMASGVVDAACHRIVTLADDAVAVIICLYHARALSAAPHCPVSRHEGDGHESVIARPPATTLPFRLPLPPVASKRSA